MSYTQEELTALVAALRGSLSDIVCEVESLYRFRETATRQSIGDKRFEMLVSVTKHARELLTIMRDHRA